MRKRILLIDDDIASVSAARRVLTEAGFDPILATNAADAEIALEHDDPQMVVLALETAGGSGLEICQSIRVQAADPALPILLIGDGSGDVVDTASALAAGGDGYFQRPVAWKRVVAKIRELPRRRRACPAPGERRGHRPHRRPGRGRPHRGRGPRGGGRHGRPPRRRRAGRRAGGRGRRRVRRRLDRGRARSQGPRRRALRRPRRRGRRRGDPASRRAPQSRRGPRRDCPGADRRRARGRGGRR